MRGMRIAWHRRRARRLELEAETLLAQAENVVKDAVAYYRVHTDSYREDEDELQLEKSKAKVEERQMRIKAEHCQMRASEHYAAAERLLA